MICLLFCWSVLFSSESGGLFPGSGSGAALRAGQMERMVAYGHVGTCGAHGGQEQARVALACSTSRRRAARDACAPSLREWCLFPMQCGLRPWIKERGASGAFPPLRLRYQSRGRGKHQRGGWSYYAGEGATDVAVLSLPEAFLEIVSPPVA